ncbi:MAG: hypothetical protein ACC645_09060 [Pirellulales bacterium]
MAEIDGSIVTGFHALVKSYEQERERLTDYAGRLVKLDAVVQDAPSDFKYPPSLPDLEELKQKPEFIESAMTDTLAEDIEDRISEHDKSSRLGNVQPLMEETKRLLAEPKRALGMLAGQVTTLENAANEYRRGLLDSNELRAIEQGFNALLQVQNKSQRKPLDIGDLTAAESLKRSKKTGVRS